MKRILDSPFYFCCCVVFFFHEYAFFSNKSIISCNPELNKLQVSAFSLFIAIRSKFCFNYQGTITWRKKTTGVRWTATHRPLIWTWETPCITATGTLESDSCTCAVSGCRLSYFDGIKRPCRAAAHSKLGNYTEATSDCERAIGIDPTYSKAYGRMGWASLLLTGMSGEK